MASRYDDELWRLVPEDPGPPPAHLAEFVRGLGRAERALDVGCGDGRLTAELDAAELTAADVSTLALERARRRLTKARLVELEPDAPFPLEDAAFDLVLCAETIEHVRDVQLLLSEIRRVLRPGARLVIETMHRDLLVRDFREHEWRLLGEGRLLLERRTFDASSGVSQATQTLIDNTGERDSRSFSVRTYTATELLAMLMRAGFEDARCHGDLAGAPFDTNTRLVVVATR